LGLLQGIIFKNIQIHSFLIPYPYLLSLFIFPFHFNRTLLLIIAFFYGLWIDSFYSTPGLHASATLLVAFVRPAVFNFLGIYLDDFSSSYQPVPPKISWILFLSYSFILLFIHHMWLFILDDFTAKGILLSIPKALLSGIFSLFFVIMFMLLTPGRK
jgi:hypothetical protein